MARRRSARADASAIALGIAAIAAAALAVHALIIGVVWLIGVLVRMMSRQPRRVQVAAMSESAAVTIEPPSALDYEERTNITALTDPSAAAVERAAVVAFRAWACTLPRSPRDPSLLLRGMRLHRRLVVRRESAIEGRRLVWRVSGFRGSAAPAGPASTDPDALEPWLPRDELVARSTHVVSCRTCAGGGRTQCARCRGARVITCANCQGTGKAYGYASNGSRRLMNCRGCEKTGRIECPMCANGTVSCDDCEGAGRTRRWLEVETWRRLDVQIEPDDYQKVFHWSKDGQPATLAQIEADAWIVGEASADGPISACDAPAAIPDADRDRILAAVQPRLQAGERVEHQRLLALEFPAVATTYGTSIEEQTVELMGRRLLAPRRWLDTAMQARARFLNAMAVALVIMPVAVAIGYLARGPYYASAEVASLVACVAVAAAFIYVALRTATLGRRPLVRLGLIAVPLVGAIALALTAEPSLRDARAHLQRGELAEALHELEALGPPTDADLAPTYADLRLAQVVASNGADDAAAYLERIPADRPQRARAQAHLDRLRLDQASRVLKDGRPREAASLLARGSPTLATSAEGQKLLTAADVAVATDCLAREEWTCVFERSRSAAQRGDVDDSERLRTAARARLRHAVDDSVRRAASASPVASKAALLQSAERDLSLLETSARAEAMQPSVELQRVRAQLAQANTALERERAAEARRAAVEAARQRAAEERARRAEERARRAEQRANRSVLCCDGSLSPTCTCGGSRRGCCSHHGGICGCE